MFLHEVNVRSPGVGGTAWASRGAEPSSIKGRPRTRAVFSLVQSRMVNSFIVGGDKIIRAVTRSALGKIVA